MTTMAKEVCSRRRSATSVVRERLQTLAQRTRAVTEQTLSSPMLHELRIACRRAEAALRLTREAANSRAWKWLRKQLRALRRECNQARDDDVLRKWVRQHDSSAARHWSRRLKEHRRALQPGIVQRALHLTNDRCFDRHVKQVVRRLQKFERSGQTVNSFGRLLFKAMHDFVQAFPTTSDDDRALHRLRVLGKRLRYAAEIVTEVWPEIDLSELHEHLRTLQDRLGTLHDLQVGQARLQQLSSKRLRSSERLLLQKAHNASDRERRRFWRWWRSCAVQRILADATAELLTLVRQGV